MTLKENKNKVLIYSPVKGSIFPIENIQDEMFSKKMLGESVAITPLEGEIYAPCDGVIDSVFATKHAICFKTNTGVEILIHVGIDTVKLNGKYFRCYCSEGQNVHKGEKLLTFCPHKISNANIDPTVIVIITNTTQLSCVTPSVQKIVDNSSVLLEIES